LENESKPLLGARPACVAIPDRINELAEAIIRCRNDTSGELLNMWAYEIILLSKVQSKMAAFGNNNDQPCVTE